ncbi:MAG: copper resistance protein CopC [Proteobacteria bacterium]|nr:copper resistance protein CopC [Pseudomonadota bacterium]
MIRLVLLLLFALASPNDADAHAMLLDSTPADGDVVVDPPARIVLRFNEPVVPVALRIVDATGATVQGPDGGYATDETGIAFDLPAKLASGRYVVAYRVVSADTHPVAGSFVFAVGLDTLESSDVEIGAGDPVLDTFWSRVAIAVRALRDLSLAVGCGGLVFAGLFGIPAAGIPRRFLVGVAILAAAATLAGTGIAGARVALAPSLLDLGVWRLGFGISAGPSAIAILLGIGATLIRGRLAPLLGMLAIAAGTALTGHAATGEPRWLVPAAQALHSLAALVWIGAFVPLLWGIARWPAGDVVRIARRFSGLGIACVIALAAAGIALAVTRIELPAGLTASGYGILVAAKSVLFVALLALAADNRLRALPADPMRLRRNVRLELAVAVCVLGTTATLSHTPPYMEEDHASHAMAARAGPSVAIVRDGRIVTVEIAGDRLSIYLADTAGVPFDPLEVEVALASPANGIAGLRRAAQRLGPGQFALREASLSIPGVWQIEIGALVTDFRKMILETELRVGPGGP